MSDEIDLDALLGDIAHPRDHHYIFAHLALAQVAFDLRSGADLEQMAADLEFFRGLWAIVGAKVAEPLADEGLAARYLRDGELEAVIVTMPEVEVQAEAIMTAIVRRPTRRMLVFRSHEVRYFTLELGVHIEDGQVAGDRTVLCEWRAARGRPEHRNYGDGPPAEVTAFAAAAFALCRPG